MAAPPFLDIPELHVEYDRSSLAQRKLHITLLRFNLAELNIVKNETGQTNIISLMNNSAPKRPRNPTNADVEFTGIDVLNLSLGKVRLLDLKDRRKGGELYIGLRDQVFRNVKSESDLLGVLFVVWLRSGSEVSTRSVAPPPKTTAPTPNALSRSSR